MLLLLGAGCSDPGPVEVFNQAAAALERGDEEGFLAHLTPDSVDLMRGLFALRGRHGETLKAGPFQIKARALDATAQEKLAFVTVKTDGEPPELARVVLRRIDGKWRIDLLATEWAWNRDWTLSGGKPRSLQFELDDRLMR